MKGTVNAARLAAAVKTAQSIIATGIKIDSLRHVRLTAKEGALEVEATNLDQHIALQIPAALSDGQALADPARLLMALAPINGDASISCTDGFMTVAGKGARSRLALLPNEHWQAVERPVPENSFDVDGESLVAAFETVAPAIGDDISRGMLMGVNLRWAGSSLIAEAFDSHLLVSREVKAHKPTAWPASSVIVPREFMTAAARIVKGGAESLSITASRIILKTPSGWLASKLLAFAYPDIDRVGDRAAAPALRADREALLKIVKLAHQFSDASAAKERSLVIANGEVLTAGPNGEMFRASFDCEYIKDQVYSFQPKILMAGLSALTSETIELTDGGSSPAAIALHGEGARACIVAQMSPPGWWRREQAKEAA